MYFLFFFFSALSLFMTYYSTSISSVCFIHPCTLLPLLFFISFLPCLFSYCPLSPCPNIFTFFSCLFSPSPLVNGSRHSGRSGVAFAKAIVVSIVSLCTILKVMRLSVCSQIYYCLRAHMYILWDHKSRALF
jgi:hypothetical protein